MIAAPAPIILKDTEAGATYQLPHRVLFLDRDGVINVNHGYVHTAECTDWVPGIFELARSARQLGFELIVVTNQAGIARGLYTVEQFQDYTRWVHAQFEREGAPLLATYYCPHHPDAGIGEYRTQCGCRKPAAGMFERAVEEFAIDVAHSAMVGDSWSDMQAATAAGVAGRYWLSPKGASVPESLPRVVQVTGLAQVERGLTSWVTPGF